MNALNGITQVYPPRDNLNRMVERDLVRSGTNFASEIYGYDAMSRLVSIDREDTKRDAFGYDLVGELNSAQYGLQNTNATVSGVINAIPSTSPIPDPGSVIAGPSGSNWANPQRAVNYVWDKSGNRTSLTDTAGGSAAYTVTNLNQYSQAGADPVTNGSEHELNNYQNITYTYINDTHLSKVSGNGDSYQLLYDALGRCAVRILNGATTYYIYDGEKAILEYGGSYHVHAANVYGRGIDEIVRRDDFTVTPNRTLYYQDDHEGSVTHLTDAGGNVIESYRYDAFGKPTIYSSTSQPLNSSTVNNRFMFTGREYVQTFGIYEYRNRAYHPGLGRFMSEDPKGFVRRIGLGTAPAEWSFAKFPGEAEYNLFRYCGNDPIDFEDPMGLDGADPAWLNFKENQLAKAQASGGGLSMSYFVYRGKWTEADAKNLERVWADPENAKKLNKYASDSIEHVITPTQEGGKLGFRITNTENSWGRTLWNDIKSILGIAQGSGNFEKMRRGDNTAANKQARDAAREAGLSKDQMARFHDEIHGRNLSYSELKQVAQDIKAENP